MKNINDFLTDFSKKFETLSKKMFLKKVKEASKVNSVATQALQYLENYISGGKKVRPALASIGFKLAGGKDIDRILPATFAVELMHNSLLIHDDYVDNDKTRRGKPTIHISYGLKNGEHYGASMAIIVADVGIFWANEIFSQLQFSTKNITEALYLFNHHLANTGYGELMDIDFDFNPDTNYEDILNVRIYKTAYYTFVMPLVVGAKLVGGSASLLKGLENYGKNVGLAFQLRDDVLGIFGDSKETGKSNESDILEGKKSMLYFKVLEMGTKEDRNYFKKNYGHIKNAGQIAKIRQIIQRSGALDYSNQLAKDYVEKGKKYIPQITNDKNLEATLSTFADFMIERTR